MGYRSTAILAVSKEARPYLMHFLGQNAEAMKLSFGKYADRTENFQGEEGSVMFLFEGIKWYDSFPEIQAIEEFMAHMSCETDLKDSEDNQVDGEELYRFVRIGEEYEDIEQRGFAFDIYPSVSIEY